MSEGGECQLRSVGESLSRRTAQLKFADLDAARGTSAHDLSGFLRMAGRAALHHSLLEVTLANCTSGSVLIVRALSARKSLGASQAQSWLLSSQVPPP